MRVFKTRWFARFARREKIADRQLEQAIRVAEEGLIDADLGSGLIKLRVARTGGGKDTPKNNRYGPGGGWGLGRMV